MKDIIGLCGLPDTQFNQVTSILQELRFGVLSISSLPPINEDTDRRLLVEQIDHQLAACREKYIVIDNVGDGHLRRCLEERYGGWFSVMGVYELVAQRYMESLMERELTVGERPHDLRRVEHLETHMAEELLSPLKFYKGVDAVVVRDPSDTAGTFLRDQLKKVLPYLVDFR